MLTTKTGQPGREANRRLAAIRVLVVEDDIPVRRVMEETFAEAGYDVDAVESVEQGLKLIQSREFDIVVADGRLEDGTGMEIADALGEGHSDLGCDRLCFRFAPGETEPRQLQHRPEADSALSTDVGRDSASQTSRHYYSDAISGYRGVTRWT